MKLFSILILCLFTFSCSKINISLALAPRYISNKIDDAFDFKSEKVSRLRTQIEIDLLNSKKELAKRLLEHLDQTEATFFTNEPTVESLTMLLNQFSATQTFLLQSFKPTADLTLKDISDKEADDFKKFTDGKFLEEIEISKDKKSFLKKRKSGFLNTFEFFLDDLTDAQENTITEFADKNLNYFADRILVRQEYSLLFYNKLKSKEPVLEYFLNNYEGKKFEAYPNDQKKYFVRLFEFEVLFWKTVSEPQKKYFKKVLQNYREELVKIANSQL